MAAEIAGCPERLQNEKNVERLGHSSRAQLCFGASMESGILYIWTTEYIRNLPLYHPEQLARYVFHVMSLCVDLPH